MKLRLLLLSSFLYCLQAGAQNRYRYSVDLTKTENDQLSVQLLVPTIKTATAVFHLPKIVPGTYVNSDFGKFVRTLRAYDRKGKLLPVKLLPDSNSWSVASANQLYSLQYTVEDTWDAAFKHKVYEMAGTNFEAGKNFVINTCGVFGYFEGLRELPFELSFTKPAGFYGASGLVPQSTSATKDVFTCTNADQLYDSPIMFSMPDTAVVKVGETDVLVAVYSPKKLIHANYVADHLSALLNAAKNYLGGKLPVKKYAFIYYFNGEQEKVQGQGAWEHSYSSFYSLPEMPQEDYISNIVDISSHEFFHIVTPLNICSKEVRQFNFNETHLSRHLWLYEGSTEYDAHHAQVTQGLISVEEYLKRLSRKIDVSTRYYNDSLSFTQLSIGAADEYAPQYGNVYQKGALINACLDIYLEKLSGGNYGFHNLKHDLSLKYGATNFFNDDALFDEITKLTFPEIRNYFARYVEGTTPIPYAAFFAMAGIRYIPQRTVMSFNLGGFGPAPDSTETYVEVKDVSKLNEFGRRMGYQQGDYITAINKEAVGLSNYMTVVAKTLAAAKEGEVLTVTVQRKGASVVLSAPMQKSEKLEKHVLELDPAADEAQLKVRRAWLNTCR